jgi:hypothetical protein
MDISKLVIPEVPIPARILDNKTAGKKKQSKSSTSGKTTRKKQSAKAQRNEKQSK